MSKPQTRTGLILPGGGARAAYQVGVLQRIAQWLPDPSKNPYAVVSGISAGAINAVAIAGTAHRHRRGLARLAGIWSNLTMDKVIETRTSRVYGRALHWLAALVAGGLGEHNPRSLFDHRPLRRLLESHMNFSRTQFNLDQGNLHALCITASAYTRGVAESFYAARETVPGWQHSRRVGTATRLDLNHLMASLALPLLFPAARVGNEYYGDGGLRDTAPFSAPIHLGARRILVIGTRNNNPPGDEVLAQASTYPTLGQIGGYILDGLFMDSFADDAEQLERVNALVSVQSRWRRHKAYHAIESLILTPSIDLRQVAQRHLHRFPMAVRHILKSTGAMQASSPLASFLLFHGDYCRELVELGHADAQANREAICALLQIEG